MLILSSYRCLKNMVHQVGGKSECLLLSVTFTANLELDFVLTFENCFSDNFYFKSNRKSIGYAKKAYQGFSKWSSVWEMETIENTPFSFKTALSKPNVKTNRKATTKWTYGKEWSFTCNYFIFLEKFFPFLEPLKES